MKVYLEWEDSEHLQPLRLLAPTSLRLMLWLQLLEMALFLNASIH